MPRRQQTLREALGWSYDLLDEREQRLLRRLAVFAGGASADAAAAVCDADPASLDSLATHSFLRGGDRLTMLETIRAYAAELLGSSGEAEEVRDRHARWFLELAEAAEPELRKPGQEAWLDRLEVEHQNLLSAIRWSLEREDDKTALRLAASLWLFWQVRGYLEEGSTYLGAVLARTQDVSTLRAKAMRGAATLARLQGHFDDARRILEESVDLSRAAGICVGSRSGSRTWGMCRWMRETSPVRVSRSKRQ